MFEMHVYYLQALEMNYSVPPSHTPSLEMLSNLKVQNLKNKQIINFLKTKITILQMSTVDMSEKCCPFP